MHQRDRIFLLPDEPPVRAASAAYPVALTILVLLSLLIGPGSTPGQEAAAPQWSLGYWTPWGNPPLPPSEIDWGALTHVVHAFALVKPDGSLDLTTQRVASDAPGLIAAAHARGVKVLLGVAQASWLGQTRDLRQATGQFPSVLVGNLMNVVNTYGFDGVDIDWEPLDATMDVPLLQALSVSLRSALGEKILTGAALVTEFNQWGSLHQAFDRVLILSYDLSGTWNPYTWHNAALYDPDGTVWSLDLAVQRFSANGVPVGKLSVGMPFFGYVWVGGGVSGPRQAWTSIPTVRQVYYQNFVSAITPDKYQWDSLARVPYLSADNYFLTYDDEQSIAEKIAYARSKGLGGWHIWELSADYVPSRTPNQPLLAAVRSHMSAPGTAGVSGSQAPGPVKFRARIP